MNTVQTPQQKEFMEMILEKVKSNRDAEKDAKDIEKKLAKGKLSDKAKPYINEFYRNVEKRKVNIRERLSKLANLKDSKGVVECMRSCFPDKEIDTRMMIVKDTVLNSSFRPALYANSESAGLYQDDEMNPERTVYKDKSDIRKNWEWVFNNEFPEKRENFPVSVKYSYSEKFPEYRIVNISSASQPEWIICDNKGNLIGIPEFTNENLSMNDKNLKDNLLAYSYKNNDLDIQNYNTHTKHYVKVQAGLESLTAKEKQESDRAATNFANAITNSMKANMKYGQGSRKAKAVERESAKKIVGALISGSDFYDDLGNRWIEEVTGLYESKLKKTYKTERINNTTFRTIYADNNGNGLFEIITEYLTDTPYRYKQKHTVKSLSGSHLFSPEDVSLYHTLRAKLKDMNRETDYGLTKENQACTLRDNSEVLAAVEQQAEFPGGQKALKNYINNNLKYPDTAKIKEIEGRVIVKFIIEKDGSISNPVVIKRIDQDLDCEAIRLIMNIPKWNPGKNNGVPVRSYFNLPIYFILPS